MPSRSVCRRNHDSLAAAPSTGGLYGSLCNRQRRSDKSRRLRGVSISGSGYGVDAYEGRFLTRGGAVEALEGDWTPSRLIVIEFPSIERAKQWIDSPEYSAIKPIRHRNARTNVIVAQGV